MKSVSESVVVVVVVVYIALRVSTWHYQWMQRGGGEPPKSFQFETSRCRVKLKGLWGWVYIMPVRKIDRKKVSEVDKGRKKRGRKKRGGEGVEGKGIRERG